MADINFLKRGGAVVSGRFSGLSGGQFLFTIFFFFSVAAVIIVLGVMVWLLFYYNNQVKHLNEMAEERKKIEEDLGPETVNKLVSADILLSNVKIRLGEHIYSSEIFNLFEKNIHTNANLTDMDFSYAERRVIVNLVVPSYVVFAEQISLWEDLPAVERVDFEAPKIESEGISFKVTMQVRPELLRRAQ